MTTAMSEPEQEREQEAMLLYAAGFNAWNQLVFPPAPLQDEPDDLHDFTRILGGDQIDRIHASLYHTAVRRNNTIVTTKAARRSQATLNHDCIHAAGPHGQVLIASPPSPGREVLVEYPSWEACEAQTDGVSWHLDAPVREIAAFEVGFAIMCEDGGVRTLGDERFADCLGRDVSDACPADEPSLVTDLPGLDGPIRHIAAGGYTVAALTEGGSLYVWGTSTAGTHRRQQAFSTLSGVPSYVEVDGEKDVRNIAVGESHAIALTADGCLYVIGGNENGQLGLGRGFKGRAETWTKLVFLPPAGFVVTGVAAGPRASFIITTQIPPKIAGQT